MPQETQSEQNVNHDKSSGIVSWWQNVHFSGRVIMCSVLFGLGFVLIGSLLFAINMDDSTNTPNEILPTELPTKPPTNVFGPVLMGMGCFILTVGIIMCLFETQVCRKRTGDASPLISERLIDPGKTDSEAASISSSSQSHRHGTHKVAASPKRSKNRHAKSHGTDRKHKKTPSPRSPPVTIERTKDFMTSSEDKFLTPPSTLIEYSGLVQSTSREAEIQTSSSIMKSFTSSGPSWNQSNEYQTPSTSFGETSVSLESSIEDNENAGIESISTIETIKSNINAGFLTPITLEEEKIEKMSAAIQNQKNDLSNVKFKEETDSNTEDHKLSEANNTVSYANYVENTVAKPIQIKCVVGEYERNENKEDKKTGREQFVIKATASEISVVSTVAEDKENTISEDNLKTESKNTEDISNFTGISGNEMCSLTGYNENETKDGNNKGDERVDLESSVSSDETVVSQDTILEKNVSDSTSEENSVGLQMRIDGDMKLNMNESESSTTSLNDSINVTTSFNVKEIESESSSHNNCQSKDNEEKKECDELSKESVR